MSFGRFTSTAILKREEAAALVTIVEQAVVTATTLQQTTLLEQVALLKRVAAFKHSLPTLVSGTVRSSQHFPWMSGHN